MAAHYTMRQIRTIMFHSHTQAHTDTCNVCLLVAIFPVRFYFLIHSWFYTHQNNSSLAISFAFNLAACISCSIIPFRFALSTPPSIVISIIYTGLPQEIRRHALLDFSFHTKLAFAIIVVIIIMSHAFSGCDAIASPGNAHSLSLHCGNAGNAAIAEFSK